jgi:large subunit ribosomal protein L13
MGKNKPNYDPSKDMGDFVIVNNVEKIKISGKKLEREKHYKHSRYLGGLKEIPLKKAFKENPSQVLKKAVFGMLPKNRLRNRMIKRLKFE